MIPYNVKLSDRTSEILQECLDKVDKSLPKEERNFLAISSTLSVLLAFYGTEARLQRTLLQQAVSELILFAFVGFEMTAQQREKIAKIVQEDLGCCLNR